MACAALVHNSPLSKGFMAGHRRGAAGGGWPCGSFPTFFTGLFAACESALGQDKECSKALSCVLRLLY